MITLMKMYFLQRAQYQNVLQQAKAPFTVESTGRVLTGLQEKRLREILYQVNSTDSMYSLLFILRRNFKGFTGHRNPNNVATLITARVRVL